MKRTPYSRFCDALQQVAISDNANTFPSVLVIGPSTTDPLDCVLAILKPLRLVAVEIDVGAVASLQKVWQDTSVRIVHSDAAELSISAPGPYDLVIIRHPDVERFRDRWAMVFAAVIANLRDGGVLLISAYSLSEVDLLRNCLSQLGLSLTYSQELSSKPVDLQGNDQNFLLGHKD